MSSISPAPQGEVGQSHLNHGQRRWLQWRRQRWRTCRRCGCKRLLVAMVLGCSCWAPLCRFVSVLVLVRSSYFSSLLVMYRVMYTHTPYYLMPHAVRARPGASQLFRSTLLSCCYPAALPAALTACILPAAHGWAARTRPVHRWPVGVTDGVWARAEARAARVRTRRARGRRVGGGRCVARGGGGRRVAAEGERREQRVGREA